MLHLPCCPPTLLGTVAAIAAFTPAAAGAGTVREASGSALGAGPPALGAGPPASEQSLSDEHKIARWAYTATAAPIYTSPGADTGIVSRLHRYTEDGFPEIYLLLSQRRDATGQDWVRLRIPMRPNGRVGWVRREALGSYHTTHDLLVVDRARLRVELLTNGRLRWSAPAGVGRPGTPTPAGHFWIRERFKIRDRSSPYWPYAFGTSDYSTLTDWPGGGVVGIHGPYFDASAIPGRRSHGCIRLRVADATWLGEHLGLGTPVRVV